MVPASRVGLDAGPLRPSDWIGAGDAPSRLGVASPGGRDTARRAPTPAPPALLASLVLVLVCEGLVELDGRGGSQSLHSGLGVRRLVGRGADGRLGRRWLITSTAVLEQPAKISSEAAMATLMAWVMAVVMLRVLFSVGRV